LLLWIYFSAIVFLFCAELGAAVLRRTRAKTAVRERSAGPVSKEEAEESGDPHPAK
jgi:uncharacterized BrkB/YihY/UPF0761 family membrane protein